MICFWMKGKGGKKKEESKGWVGGDLEGSFFSLPRKRAKVLNKRQKKERRTCWFSVTIIRGNGGRGIVGARGGKSLCQRA